MVLSSICHFLCPSFSTVVVKHFIILVGYALCNSLHKLTYCCSCVYQLPYERQIIQTLILAELGNHQYSVDFK